MRVVLKFNQGYNNEVHASMKNELSTVGNESMEHSQ